MTDPQGFTDDSVGYLTALAIGDLIPDALEQRGLPGVCDGGVMPGAEVAFDQCGTDCPGLWWARVGRIFPSTTFPNQDVTSHSKVPLLLAQEYEIGLVRGMDLPDEGQPTETEDLARMARLQLADMRALLDVICHYFRSTETPYVVGDYVPNGPLGGCVGGSWTVTAGVKGLS